MRRGELIVNFVFVFGPPVVGLLVVASLSLAPLRTPWMAACFALYAAGVSLLFAAKMSLLRRGVWISFGSSRMSRGNRACYRIAYALLVSGVILNLMLILSTVVPG